MKQNDLFGNPYNLKSDYKSSQEKNEALNSIYTSIQIREFITNLETGQINPLLESFYRLYIHSKGSVEKSCKGAEISLLEYNYLLKNYPKLAETLVSINEGFEVTKDENKDFLKKRKVVAVVNINLGNRIIEHEIEVTSDKFETKDFI